MRTICLILAVGFLVAGCSPPASAPTASPSATSPAPDSGPPDDSSSESSLDLAPDAPKTEAAARAGAVKLMLNPDEVPGTGWEKGGPVESDTFRQWVCGVDTEPHQPIVKYVAKRINEDKKILLVETLRPIGATRARQLVRALDKTLETCKKDRRARHSGEVLTFDIERLKVSSPGAVAFRQMQTSGGLSELARPVDLLFCQEGDSLVVFIVYWFEVPATTEFLDQLVAAMKKRARR